MINNQDFMELDDTIETLNRCLQGLGYRSIEFTFTVPKRLQMNYFSGAVLRNRFLWAAEQVITPEGVSLRTLLDTLPLNQDHFLYRQLCGGFPKGFLIDCSYLPYKHPGFILEENRIYIGYLTLIGKCVAYEEEFHQAMERMFEKGFGHPIQSVLLLDWNVHVEAMMPQLEAEEERMGAELDLVTPVCLVHSKSVSANGYQNKMNGFPSFYQLMRSLIYRLTTLSMLYADDATFSSKDDWEQCIDRFLEPAQEAVLLHADILYANRYSTPKKGKNRVYVMEGYVGNLIFDSVLKSYRSLLEFGTAFGVGNDINYGLGMFRMNI